MWQAINLVTSRLFGAPRPQPSNSVAKGSEKGPSDLQPGQKEGLQEFPLPEFRHILNPRCINTDQQICLSARGFLTPCCWFDDNLKNEPWLNNFFLDHLNIANNENVEDIFNSKEWTDFFHMIKYNPADAPPTCKRMCGGGIVIDKDLFREKKAGESSVTVRIRH